MHWTSKLILWLTGLNLLISGICAGCATTMIHMNEKGLFMEGSFKEKALMEWFIVHGVYMLAGFPAAVWVLHGKPAKDKEYVPALALVMASIAALLHFASRFPG